MEKSRAHDITKHWGNQTTAALPTAYRVGTLPPCTVSTEIQAAALRQTRVGTRRETLLMRRISSAKFTASSSSTVYAVSVVHIRRPTVAGTGATETGGAVTDGPPASLLPPNLARKASASAFAAASRTAESFLNGQREKETHTYMNQPPVQQVHSPSRSSLDSWRHAGRGYRRRCRAISRGGFLDGCGSPFSNFAQSRGFDIRNNAVVRHLLCSLRLQ